MIGEGQDAKILPNGEGLTHREMNWFKTGGRGLNGEFSETTGVIHCNNEARRKVVTGGADSEFNGEMILPFRAILFAMDVTVKNMLHERLEETALREGKCGTHLCTDCGDCREYIHEPTRCCMNESKICDGCWEC